jgi:hypothetical protein
VKIVITHSILYRFVFSRCKLEKPNTEATRGTRLFPFEFVNVHYNQYGHIHRTKRSEHKADAFGNYVVGLKGFYNLHTYAGVKGLSCSSLPLSTVYCLLSTVWCPLYLYGPGFRKLFNCSTDNAKPYAKVTRTHLFV